MIMLYCLPKKSSIQNGSRLLGHTVKENLAATYSDIAMAHELDGSSGYDTHKCFFICEAFVFIDRGVKFNTFICAQHVLSYHLI